MDSVGTPYKKQLALDIVNFDFHYSGDLSKSCTIISQGDGRRYELLRFTPRPCIMLVWSIIQ